jgi:hypothetical protein
MKAISLEPQLLIDVLVGQKCHEVRNENTDYRGELLVAANAIKQKQLPYSMAGGIVNLTDVVDLGDGNFDWEFSFVDLIRPFKVRGEVVMYDVDDTLIHREPVNWYNTDAENAAHQEINEWIGGYIASHPDIERIPRTDLPDNIAEMAESFDQWRLAYYPFIYQPSKQQKLAFRKVRYDVGPK